MPANSFTTIQCDPDARKQSPIKHIAEIILDKAGPIATAVKFELKNKFDRLTLSIDKEAAVNGIIHSWNIPLPWKLFEIGHGASVKYIGQNNSKINVNDGTYNSKGAAVSVRALSITQIYHGK